MNLARNESDRSHRPRPVQLSAVYEVKEHVDDLDDAIDPTQREQLVAYGLSPNRPLVVPQQRPMTIVMIDEVRTRPGMQRGAPRLGEATVNAPGLARAVNASRRKSPTMFAPIPGCPVVNHDEF